MFHLQQSNNLSQNLIKIICVITLLWTKDSKDAIEKRNVDKHVYNVYIDENI